MRSFPQIIVLALVTLTLAPLASAVDSQTTNEHSLTVGWAHVPATVDSPNAVLLQVWQTDPELPVSGLASMLRVTAAFGNDSKTIALKESTEVPGSYQFAIEHTMPGIYTIHIEGRIAEDNVSKDFILDAVAAEANDRFPEQRADTGPAGTDVASLTKDIEALKSRVAALEAEAKTQANTPATVTEQAPTSAPVPFAGLAAILCVAALAGLMLRRKRVV